MQMCKCGDPAVSHAINGQLRGQCKKCNCTQFVAVAEPDQKLLREGVSEVKELEQ